MKNLGPTLVLLLMTLAALTPAQAQMMKMPALTSGPTTNVRLHPLHLLMNSFGIDLEFKAGENWVAGPSLAFFNKDEGTESKQSRATFIGARGTYTFDHKSLTTGWYLAPFGGIASVQIEKIDSTRTQGKGSQSGLLLGGYGGYQYFWDQFNTNVGIGYAFNTTDKVEVGYFDSGRIEEVDNKTFGGFVWEASVGYSW